MPRVCTICTRPEREAIDRALVGGTACREVAALYRVSPDAVERHKAAHLPKTLTEARQAADGAHALDVVKQLHVINGVSLQILNEARQGKDPQTALKAVDRIHRQIELQAKLLGQLDERPQVNILMAPEWLQVRAALLTALASHPEARRAVTSALVALEAPPALEVA